MTTRPIAGQSAVAWINDHTARNRCAWLSIAAALDTNPMRDLAEHARQVAAARAPKESTPCHQQPETNP